MKQLSELRQELLAMVEIRDALAEKELGFKKAHELLVIILADVVKLVQGPNSLQAIEAITAVQQNMTILCAEGGEAELQVRSLLRVSLSLIDTIEILRATLNSSQVAIPPAKLDQWLSRQIADLDPDNAQAS